ncbi:bifunctional DNA primase/polymerase [Verrucosispora sp. NA02020]|uniref:bifunctional DNA primase/polymerase n=1 Tax=Verrucosispora sp. NA02020 TaxID=2742132 RepID=UPI003D71B90D
MRAPGGSSEVTAATASSVLLKAALRYVRAGWPVFPCQPDAKVPFPHSRGFKDATVDQDVITSWWTRCPLANIGLATGGPGPDVVDFDVKAGAPGRATYERLRDAGLLVGCHATVTTPSGGFHLYYLGTEQGNGSLSRHGVDFRGRGGYVLAPPSTVDGKPYVLASRRSRFDGQARTVNFGAIRRHLNPPTTAPRGVRPDRNSDHSALVAWVAGRTEGGRNSSLHWAACRAIETGADDQVLTELVDAATSAGLPRSEAERTVASAQRGSRR